MVDGGGIVGGAKKTKLRSDVPPAQEHSLISELPINCRSSKQYPTNMARIQSTESIESYSMALNVYERYVAITALVAIIYHEESGMHLSASICR